MKRKYFLIALIISILSLLGEKSLAQSSADNYLVLVSGEKINNISKDQWKQLFKKNKVEINGRTILNDSIEYFISSGENYYVIPGGQHLKQVIAGKVSAYGFTVNATSKSFATGLETTGKESEYWVKKAGVPVTRMSIPVLQTLLADNPDAVEKLDELAKKFFKRNNPKYQLEIIRFYNGDK